MNRTPPRAAPITVPRNNPSDPELAGDTATSKKQLGFILVPPVEPPVFKTHVTVSGMSNEAKWTHANFVRCGLFSVSSGLD
jgi:hypothetical protein